MRPYTFSKRQFQESLRQFPEEQAKTLYYRNWRQAGSNVRYIQEEPNEDSKKKYYIISFDFQFGGDSDEVYFAACPPYSYTYLMKELTGLGVSEDATYTVTVESLGKTVCGISIPIVTVRQKEEYRQDTQD